MKSTHCRPKAFVLLVVLALAAALAGCQNNPAPVTSSAPTSRAFKPNITDAKRLSDGANKLLDAMSKPTQPFHFSFKSQENINDKYPRDKTVTPRVGPVAVQADISPQKITLTETRGQTTKETKAKKGDDLDWAIAGLSTLGVMTSPNFVIVVGSTVTSSPSTDLVGATPADKFTFDTMTATPSQKMGLEAARMVLTTIKDCKGTAWIAKDSGLLIKFNIDADYLDQYNHAWKEHYEGEVTPK
jgi:hypothetical protein